MAEQTPKEQYRAKFNAERARYMSHEISHQEFYLWLAAFIGVDAKWLPVTKQEICHSRDPHFNDINMAKWDSRHYPVTNAAYRMGLSWSNSDTVCVLKSLAREIKDTCATCDERFKCYTERYIPSGKRRLA